MQFSQKKRKPSLILQTIAYYPLTLYFGVLIVLAAAIIGGVSIATGWKVDFGAVWNWVKNNQTLLLVVTTALLGSTLIASAIAHRKVSNLSQKEYLMWLQQRGTRTLFPFFIPLHDWLRLRIAIYRWWHTKVYASAVHFILLLVFGIAVTLQVAGVASEKPFLVSPIGGGGCGGVMASPNKLVALGIVGEAEAATLSYFTVTGITDPVTAGSASSVTVTAYDCADAVKTDYVGTIHFTSSDGQAVLPSNYTFVGGDAGVHTFTNSVTMKTSGEQSVTVNDTVSTNVTGSQTAITVNPASIANIYMTGLPSQTVSGTALTPTVAAKDTYGNLITSYTGTVHFSSNDGSATLPANYTFVGGDGGTHTFTNGVTLVTVGAKTVTVADVGNGALTSTSNVTVNPTTQSGNVPIVFTTCADVAGNSTAWTNAGNAVGTDGTLATNSLQAASQVSGTYYYTTAVYQGAWSTTTSTANFSDLSVGDTTTWEQHSGTGFGSKNITGFFDAGSAVTASSITAQIVAISDTGDGTYILEGSANSTTWTTIASGAAGNPTGLNVTTGFSSWRYYRLSVYSGSQDVGGTVRARISDWRVNTTPVADYIKCTQLVNQVPTNATIVGVAIDVLRKSSVSSTITDTNFYLVKAGTIQTGWTNKASATQWPTTLTTASYGGSSDMWGGTLTASDVNATNFGVALRPVGSAAATASIDSITGTLYYTVPATTSLTVSGITTPTTAGTARSVTVTAKDSGGTTNPAYRGTITFTSNDGQATLPSNYTFTSGDAGVHTFTNGVTLKTAGTRSVTATDTVTASINGTQSSITVNPGSASTLTVTGIANPLNAGTARDVTVTAKDAYSNTVTGYTGTITFTSSDGQAVLPSNYTFVGGDSGTHTFTGGVTLKTSGTQSVTATDTVTGTITGSQTGITVNAGSTSQLVVSGITTPTTAGTARSVTVTAKDTYNNTTTGYTGTVTFTSNDGQAVLPSNYTFVGGDAGTHTFTNGVTLKTAGTRSVTAADTVTSSITGTQSSITVNPASAATLSVSGITTPTTAGTARNVTVTAKDTYNNTATGYTGTITFTSSDGQAALQSNYTFVGGDAGTHTFTNAIILKTAGTQSVTATDTVTGTITGSQTGITVNPASAATLTVTGITTPTTAGVARNVTVTAKDTYDNTATGYTGTVVFSSSDSQATLPSNYTFVGGDAGVHTFINGVVLKTVGNRSVTATDTVTGTITGTQSSITVNPASASTLTVTGVTTPTTAGVARNVTVTAFDAYNNTATGYTGTITFTSSDGQAVLASNYTFVGGDSGTHTFTNGVTLKTSGTQSVTATDTVTGTITGSQTGITVNPASAATLTVTGITTPTEVGIARNVTVTAKDAYNNTATGYAGTITFTSTDAQATLPSNYTFVGGDAGTHTFSSSVTFTSVGTHSVTATDTVTGTITGSQSGIVVNPATASTLTVVTGSTTLTAGASTNVTVTAKDVFGNTVTNYAGTITFTSTDAQATLPSNYTFVGGDNGVHTFTNGVTLKTAGTKSVTAADTNTSSITGSQINITVSAAAASSITIVGSTSATSAGTTYAVTTTVKDAYNNTATGYRGTVAFESSDTTATLPGAYSFTAADGGSHSFASGITFKKAGIQTLVLKEAASGLLSSNTLAVTVSAGSFATFIVTPSTTTLLSGDKLSITISAYDGFSNALTSYAGKVSFTSTDTKAVLPSDYTFISSDAGTHTFDNVVFQTAGSQKITVTDTASGTSQSSPTITVLAISKIQTISSYLVTTTTPQTVGIGWKEKAIAVDDVSAVVTNDSSTVVSVTSSNPAVTFYTDDTFTTETTTYKLSSGQALLYLKSTAVGDVVIAVEDANAKHGSSTMIQIKAAPVVKVDEPAPQPPKPVAGNLPILHNNPKLEQAVNVAATVSSGIALLTLAPTGAAIATLVTVNLVQGASLFNLALVGIGRRRRRRKEWGVVRNGMTHLPLAGVFVELYDELGRFVSKVLTDKSGKFAFLVEKRGNYRIRINNPLYEPYLSQQVIVTDPSKEVIKEVITLQPIVEAVESRVRRVAGIIRFLEIMSLLNWPLLILGTALSIAVLYNSPSFWRYALMVVYLILWIFKYGDVKGKRVFGTVQDNGSSTAQPLTVVQLTKEDADGPQVVRSTITDSRGRFLLIAQPDKYNIVAAKSGFLPKEAKVQGESIGIDIKLDRQEDLPKIHL